MRAHFAVCPYCGEKVPLFLYAKHVQACKQHEKVVPKPKSYLKRLFSKLRNR